MKAEWNSVPTFLDFGLYVKEEFHHFYKTKLFCKQNLFMSLIKFENKA